jgi:hypothetical protein
MLIKRNALFINNSRVSKCLKWAIIELKLLLQHAPGVEQLQYVVSTLRTEVHVDQCSPTRNKAVTGWCCASICLYYNYSHYLVLKELKASTTLSFSESSARHCMVCMNYSIPEDA